MVKITITINNKAGQLLEQITREFHMSYAEYKDFFAALCAGVDTGKYQLADSVTSYFGIEKVLSS